MHIAKKTHLPHLGWFAATLLLAAALSISTVLGIGCLSTRSASDGGAPRGYSVAVLGDIHYDAQPAERVHAAGKPLNHQRNIMMWE